MAEQTLEKVEGAGILSALAGLFFKDLDKALSDRAEYEEEMGVLKQVNRISVKSNDGKGTYDLTIKLSPVRGKDSYYYVEAETNAPGLDVSKIHERTMEIDNTNINQFKKLISNLISKSNYTAEGIDSSNTDEGENEDNNINVKEYTDAANKYFNEDHSLSSSTPDGTELQLNVEFDVEGDDCYLTVNCYDKNKKKVITTDDKIGNEPMVVSFRDEEGNPLSKNEFIDEISDVIDDFADNAGLSKVNHSILLSGSTVVSATFIRDNEGIGLTAIKASDDLDRTMEIIYDIMDSDEFADQIPKGEEASFTITDEGGNYDIEPVDEIEVSNHYIDVYRMVSNMYITLKSIQSMIGMKVFNADNFFNDLNLAVTDFQTKVSTWAFDKADVLEILKDPCKLVPTFEAYRNYSDNSDIPGIKDSLREEFNGLLTILDFVSVNASEDELVALMQFSEAVHEVIDE